MTMLKPELRDESDIPNASYASMYGAAVNLRFITRYGFTFGRLTSKLNAHQNWKRHSLIAASVVSQENETNDANKQTERDREKISLKGPMKQ